MIAWQVAQLNVGHLHHPVDHPATADFTNNLDTINAVAEAAPGFVGRLQGENGNATGYGRDGDPLRILNLSVWESIEALRDFTYDERHRHFLRRRGEWFRPPDGPHLVLWWVPAGHRPTIEEAEDRLARLSFEGPGPTVFTFARPQAPPAG